MKHKSSTDLLQFTPKGIWCPPADVYIDPWRPVKKAMITHGHADHSRYGHRSYLASTTAGPAIKYRLGDINLQTINFGEKINVNGVQFSFHPAGHILGSAQIRVEHKGEVWVASGDYKLEDDGLAEAFEPVKCHTFITESTFGLPVYDWQPQEAVFADINDWWRKNAAEGKVSFITGYSLGKAQRILQGLDSSIGKIYTHGAVENINEVMRLQGIPLPDTIRVTGDISSKDYPTNLVLAPPSALNSAWMKKFKPISIAIASGWMTLRGARRRKAVERGFVLSDHVDWKDLNKAIEATEASRVIVTHGYTSIYTKYLLELGLDAEAAQTEFTGESIDEDDTPSDEKDTTL
ncbi:ligase-associated DNA damage response exonuclease [Neolewinella persica]|uniref:ligase-associated DNA damage response exonuclease n=1 Tax=Neolewinella persica TaxID=70998 RepID=UPI00036A56FF|nr:ligase-associated DNA damage response exonuclease [Neolewinella persica]